ncbi:hypothetical protein LOTGIDRAFT_162115 [Lottia gigantea]|uniref:Protrudin n=1 Tax=Lottia gigantea TaxID=225164 RepID=V3ZNY5_LOTGI|nr:hypothetical protein LOTGIDRAFT_162115 [Lottia gigantea]ESO93093.1 hypothetical protein LOTGIDRAFT_162115 [Lottia gigantea]
MKTMEEEEKKETEARVDLADFVFEVDRFTKLIEPFAFCFYFLDDVRRWRNPVLSGVLLVTLNLSCLILTKGSVFVFASLAVICIASVSLFHIHTKILNKVLPETRRLPRVYNGEDINTLQTVRQFRYSLIEMHDFVIKCNEYLSSWYCILKWEKTLTSLIFHIEVCVFILSLVVMSTRINCFMFFNWFFLCHQDSINYIKNMVVPDENKVKLRESNGVTPDIKSKTDTVDVSDEDNMVPLEDNMVPLDSTPNKPGMVARLLELKRRRQQASSENCFACKVAFSAFLKRRYYCRHCGKDFCNKCCNQKVPRSVFGATAPAAQTETVLVCNNCQKLLATGKDIKSKVWAENFGKQSGI